MLKRVEMYISKCKKAGRPAIVTLTDPTDSLEFLAAPGSIEGVQMSTLTDEEGTPVHELKIDLLQL